MANTVTTGNKETTLGNIQEPMGARYGKLMMWFFIVSDALTFTGFLGAYGFSRFKFIKVWPLPDEVFNHFPFMHGKDMPMLYVAFMTFILIFSSVTMVLAVDAGHKLQRGKVAVYMFLTIIGGFIFLGSQAWEWKNFIHGQYGAVETKGGSILQFVDNEGKRVALNEFAANIPHDREQLTRGKATWFMEEGSLSNYNIEEVKEGFKNNKNLLIRIESIYDEADKAENATTVQHSLCAVKHKTILTRTASEAMLSNGIIVVEGANLIRNEYGQKSFADFFFFITGFHGFHVFTGVLLNIIIFFNVLLGTYDKRRNYEMIEKVGLYWHFVDLVWVFVFTFFYLV